MTDWQDISSAPKDGTVVDLWTTFGTRVPSMCWRVVNRAQVEGWTDDWYGHGQLYADQQFTHWMPLPEPPSPTPEPVQER